MYPLYKNYTLWTEVESVDEMGMTNKQFSGFVRLIMKAIKNAMEKIPEEYTPPFKEVIDILQSMLEDGE